MKRHLLVYDDGNGSELDLRAFVEMLDHGAEIYTLDDHVCFVKSGLAAAEISKRFEPFAGSRLFFVADFSTRPGAGRMPGSFWDYMKKTSLPTAAE
jgi:hypothetical protein